MTNPVFTRVVKPPYVKARNAVSAALFDRRYGVTTAVVLGPTELGVSGADRAGYKPVGLRSMRRILPPREVSGQDVFVDFGSGMGRAVLQAALHYPFRQVYGVELSQTLHRVAERNLERVRDRLRCRDVRLVCSDVLDFEIPDDVTVAFLYNPFRGRIFASVVGRLLESVDRNPRRLRIVYGNPYEEAMLLGTGRIERVRSTRGWRPDPEWSRSNSYRLYEVISGSSATWRSSR